MQGNYSTMSAGEILRRSRSKYNYIDTQRAGACLRAFMVLAGIDHAIISLAEKDDEFQKLAAGLLIKRKERLAEMIEAGILI